MPPSLHAVLGASSAHRWLACTPSARLHEHLQQRFGTKESPYALEGTKAHALAELKVRHAIYKEDKMTASKLSRLPKTIRDSYPGINDFRYKELRKALGEIPKDMEQATDSYQDVVMQKFLAAKSADPNACIFLEQRLDYSQWVPSGFGTGDCIIVSDNLLEVIDLKYGQGIPVQAENNPQLRLYALGALAAFGDLYDFKSVRYTIIQPRLDSVSDETLTRGELLKWAEDSVVERAKLAWKGEGEFVPGEHCRFCAAKAVCSARVSEALKTYQYGFEAPGLLPDEQLPDILATLDVAEQWIKDIREYAEKQALAGQRIRGWKLVHGKRPNRVWSDKEAVEAQLLRAGYPKDSFTETKLLPVGSIEKTLGKAAFESLLGSLVHQGEGRPILVPEDDKRIEITSAESAFGDLVIEEKEK